MKLLIIVMLMQLLAGCVVTDKIKQIQTGFEWRGVKNVSAWQSAGVKTPEEAKKWMAISINSRPCNNTFCEERFVGNWTRRGITNPSTAKQWKDSGLKSFEIFGYLDNGIKSIESAKKWKKVDCGSYANDCIKAGIKDPDALKIWFDAGFNKKEIIAYVTFGVHTLSEATAWKNAGVDEYKISQWREKGTPYKDAKAQVDKALVWSEISPEHASLWINTGLTPSQAKTWINAGFPLGYYWVAFGVKNINTAKKWKKAGIPDGYSWIKLGITDLNEAKRWKTMGFDLETASIIKKQGMITSTQLNKTCGKVINNTAFTSSNPYKYKNKCVSTCVNVQQVLSSSKVFGYTTTSNFVVQYINPNFVAKERFVKASASKKLLDGFAAGGAACGIYKIQKTEDISLVDGRSVKGNALKRIVKFEN